MMTADKKQQMISKIAAGQSVFLRYDSTRWSVAGPADTITAGATVTVTKASGQTSRVLITSASDIYTDADGTQYRIAFFTDAPVAKPAYTDTYTQYDSYRAPRDRSDHEDCLTYGGCVHHSPDCPYTFAHRH